MPALGSAETLLQAPADELMYSTEPTVAHDDDLVTLPGLGSDLSNYALQIRAHRRALEAL